MKLYNETHIEERDLLRQVEQWQTQGLVTAEQLTAIRAAYPRRFKLTNPFIEIGLFLFTIIAAMSAYGLVTVLFSGLNNGQSSLGVVAILFGIGLFFLTKTIVGDSNLCRNGVDNALVLLVPLFLIGGLILLFPITPPFWVCCLIALPILLAMIWYTGDTILTYFALFALYGGLFHRLLDYGWGKPLLPFIFMAVSVGLYALASRLPNSAYYADVLSQVRWTSLVVLAAAGNYFVVRELNGLLLDHRGATPEIPLRGLFWATTFGIPSVYALLGFRRKSRMFVILAVLGLAAAVATVRHYYGTWPLSVALAVDGTVLIGLAVLAIRLLRAPRYGFSDDDDGEAPLLVVRHAGTLTTLQGTANAQQQPTGPRFGGGDFGGGGAGDAY
ncbi:hypothetical protein J2I47_08270 [Fibrella sp. HMF5335]|uniref:DUF2157 domain-containing protein n=1 Tax=Fibrella rubiginis TaxID=2817060 RepID=A0A939K2P5_9BACT|nr:hypothetical protein [Fibrella rubiginis]MBO0936534.1 hypothetical protein [Fibrella rubiginis]